jgi:hypothetical protein
MRRASFEYVHEGKYAAKVDITLVDDDTEWSPHVDKEDVRKLDRVRLALRRGDVAAAAKDATVYTLVPATAE